MTMETWQLGFYMDRLRLALLLVLMLPRSALLARLKELARELELERSVVRVAVFRAIVRPPTAAMSSYLKRRGSRMHGSNYDLLVLIETTSPSAAHALSRICDRQLGTVGCEPPAPLLDSALQAQLLDLRGRELEHTKLRRCPYIAVSPSGGHGRNSAAACQFEAARHPP